MFIHLLVFFIVIDFGRLCKLKRQLSVGRFRTKLDPFHTQPRIDWRSKCDICFCCLTQKFYARSDDVGIEWIVSDIQFFIRIKEKESRKEWDVFIFWYELLWNHLKWLSEFQGLHVTIVLLLSGSHSRCCFDCDSWTQPYNCLVQPFWTGVQHSLKNLPFGRPPHVAVPGQLKKVHLFFTCFHYDFWLFQNHTTQIAVQKCNTNDRIIRDGNNKCANRPTLSSNLN